MALVAFDLDNTLGSFDATGPWASFFSVETLENGFNGLRLPLALAERLHKAEEIFIDYVKECKELFELIFRPNLDALIVPLVKAKRSGKVRAICMYSNTSCTFSMHFAKKIIEERYGCPGFFDCMVDATHPIRKYDWEQNKADKIQPLKTFVNLRRIFRELCGITDEIQPERILFVDDRVEKHHLEHQEKDGLTYLQVSGYVPNISQKLRKRVYFMGLQTLLETGLIDDPAYLSSKIFRRGKGAEEINGFFDLLGKTEDEILEPYFPAMVFKHDTIKIRRIITTFLGKFSKERQRMK